MASDYILDCMTWYWKSGKWLPAALGVSALIKQSPFHRSNSLRHLANPAPTMGKQAFDFSSTSIWKQCQTTASKHKQISVPNLQCRLTSLPVLYFSTIIIKKLFLFIYLLILISFYGNNESPWHSVAGRAWCQTQYSFSYYCRIWTQIEFGKMTQPCTTVKDIY